MLYIAIDDNGKATGYASDSSLFEAGTSFISRWDYKGWDHVQQLAAELTEETGKLFMATDSGGSVSPRYDVIMAPQIGDDVSMSFNGDSYPVGKITRISKTFKKITTDSGKTFYRRRQTGSWSEGTFSMVRGIHNERNPHI